MKQWIIIICFLALGILAGCTTRILIKPTVDFHKHNMAVLHREVTGVSIPDAYKYKEELIDKIAQAMRRLSPDYEKKVLDRETIGEKLENSKVELKEKPDPWEMPHLGKALGVDLFLFIDIHDFSGKESPPKTETYGKTSSTSLERNYTIEIKAQLFDAKHGTCVWELREREYVTDTEVKSYSGAKALDAMIDLANILSGDKGLEEVREKCIDRIADKVASEFSTLRTRVSPTLTKTDITVYSDELEIKEVVNEATISINRITSILDGEQVEWQPPKGVFTNSEGVASLELPEGFYQFTARKGKRAGDISSLVNGKIKEINIVIRQE